MKIGVISDIHFGRDACTPAFSVPGENVDNENSGYNTFESGLIQYLKEEKLSILLVAGDLTSVASPQEFYYCEKKILDIAQSAEIPGENVICCMGNHDVDWRISGLSVSPSSVGLPENDKSIIKSRYQKVASYAAECDLSELPLPEQHGPVSFSGIVKRNGIVIFVLNSGWLCSKEQDYPHGKLSGEQLSWFKSEAQKYADADDIVKIILFTPSPGSICISDSNR